MMIDVYIIFLILFELLKLWTARFQNLATSAQQSIQSRHEKEEQRLKDTVQSSYLDLIAFFSNQDH